MKLRTIAVVAGAAGLFVHASAQNAPATDGKTTPAAPETKRAAQAAADRDTFSAGDPRRCLEFSTNLEVHTCAEKYRPHKRNA
jgi:hypothetical protein